MYKKLFSCCSYSCYSRDSCDMMVNMAKHKKGRLALKILLLISAGAAIPAILVAPNMAKVLIPALHKLARKLESRPFIVKDSITALKDRKLIRTEIKNGETIFVVTNEGEKHILRGKIEAIKIPIPQKWDKKWRLIIFDIPEQYKKAREALRWKFKELDLYKLQKSCFVYPFECKEEIDFITEFFGVSKYVNYIIVESLEGESKLKQHFEL